MNVEEYLNKLTLRNACLIGVGIAVFYYFVMFDSGLIKKNQTKTTNAKIAELKRKIKSIESKIVQAGQYQQTVAELGSELTRIIKYIPSDFTSSQLIRIVSVEAASSGLRIEDIKDASAKGKKYDFYQEIMVQVKINGRYNQMLTFLSFLTRVNKIITIHDFKLTGSKSKSDETGLKLDITLVGYRYVQPKDKS